MGWQLFGSGLNGIRRTGRTFLYECCAIAHIGNHRANQEDNFFIGEFLTRQEQASMSQAEQKAVRKNLTADNGRNRIFAVSDGMGGHRDGEIASCMAVEALVQFIDADRTAAFRRRRDKFAYIQEFQRMIWQTNREMLAYSGKEGGGDGMGSTLSGLIAFADEMVPFNIGDSSVFLYEDGRLRKLTSDDNEAAAFGKSGRCFGLPADDGAESGEGGRISLMDGGRRLTKYFGLPESGGMLTAAISEPIPLRGGQVYLICSDGLTDSLAAGEIERILAVHESSADRMADRLIENALAAEGGGHDNITAVVLKIQKTVKGGRTL